MSTFWPITMRSMQAILPFVSEVPMLFDSPLVARRSLLAALCLTPLLPLPVWSRNLQPYRARRQLLGTEITITVADDSQPHVAERVGQAFAEMQRLERLMSRFDPASQVSLINRSNGPVTVAPELLAVLQQARVLSARTQGLFNPLLGRFTAQADPQGRPLPGAVARSLLQHTQPSALALDTGKRQVRLRHPAAQLDLGGVAKLPILQAGLDKLAQSGLRGVMVNGGGDVLVTTRPDDQPWRIGIRDAHQPQRLLAVLPLQAGVVASSGDYERFHDVDGRRYHHIMDPATGLSTQGVNGLTMVMPTANLLNGLGTAAMVAGPEHAMQRLQQWGVPQAVLMHADGRVQASAALLRQLQPAPGQTSIRGLNA